MAVTVGTLISPARRAMVLSGLLTAGGAVLSVVPYAALRNMAAIWLGESNRVGWAGGLWAWAIIAVASLFAAQVLYLMGLGVTHLAEARLRHLLRTRVVDAIGHLPLGSVASIPHGAIRKMVADDTSSIHTLVAHVPGDATNAVVGVAAGMIYLLWTDWRLALALLGVWCLVLAAIAVPTMRGLGDITDRFGVAQTRLASATVEMLEGIKEIKGFQAADATRTRFDAARARFSDLSYEWVSASGRTMSLMGAVLRPAAVFATVAPLVVLFVTQGWTRLSDTLPFFLLAPGLPEGLLTLVGLMQHTYESRMAARTTADLLSREPMPEGAHEEEGPTPGRVEVDGVTFSYEAGSPVLRDVSLTAEPGTVTALVGPSGGGKSTLVRLIARFYDVDSGAVRVGGVDVRAATFSWLFTRIAVMLQDVELSHDSVADNIALGRPGASREQIEAAARAACIHERITRLPRGYDTVLGEEGGFLSGGEQQRVALARAYLQDAPILLLDEATAQADPASERDIHRALSRLAAGRTVIIIAHRLSTVRDADQILVVDGGRVVERGRHHELMAADGRYASMWRSQDTGSESGDERDHAGTAPAGVGEGE